MSDMVDDLEVVAQFKVPGWLKRDAMIMAAADQRSLAMWIRLAMEEKISRDRAPAGRSS